MSSRESMNTHKALLIMVLAVAAAVPGLAQQTDVDPENRTENPKITTKIDEFGRATDCDLSARVDNLISQLHNNADSLGYIITYNSTQVLPSEYDSNRMAARIRRAMELRRYDLSRVTFIDGGFREELAVELFIVPPDGAAPEPSDQVDKPATPKGTHLWTKATLLILSEEGYEQE